MVHHGYRHPQTLVVNLPSVSGPPGTTNTVGQEYWISEKEQEITIWLLPMKVDLELSSLDLVELEVNIMM